METRDVEILTAMSATLTVEGVWIIPAWLNDLRVSHRLADIPNVYTIDWNTHGLGREDFTVGIDE